MRIAILHGSNDLYGASRVLLDDARILVLSGADVTVVLPEDGPLTSLLRAVGCEVSVEDLHVLRKVSGWRPAVRVPLRLPRSVVSADVVVVWTLALAAYLPALRCRRKRVVTSVHEILDSMLGRGLALATLAMSHCVIVNSQTTGRWLVAGASRWASYFVAYPAAPDWDPLPPRSDSQGALVALLAGRVNGHKGHLEAVVACDHARRHGCDVRLVLVGGPFPGQEHHRDELVREIAGKEWATYLGEVPDIRPYLADADVVLVPTTRPEPFGVVALEAWAAGRRIIASATGGLAEACELVEGITVPPGDGAALAQAITRVARSPELRASPSCDAPVASTCTRAARAEVWQLVAAQLLIG